MSLCHCLCHGGYVFISDFIVRLQDYSKGFEPILMKLCGSVCVEKNPSHFDLDPIWINFFKIKTLF